MGAPYIEYLRGKKSLSTALSGITAAVVGVILNLAVWFSLHTLFGSLTEAHSLAMRLLIPQWETIDIAAVAIAAGAFIALFHFKWGMIPTLAASAGAGLVYHLIFRQDKPRSLKDSGV